MDDHFHYEIRLDKQYKNKTAWLTIKLFPINDQIEINTNDFIRSCSIYYDMIQSYHCILYPESLTSSIGREISRDNVERTLKSCQIKSKATFYDSTPILHHS